MNQPYIKTIIIIFALVKVGKSKLFVEEQKVEIVFMIATIPKSWPIADQRLELSQHAISYFAILRIEFIPIIAQKQ